MEPEAGNFGLQDGAAVVALLTLLYSVIVGTLSYFMALDAVLFCMLCVVAATMVASEALEKKHPAAPTLFLLGLLVVLFAFSTGVTNYHHNYGPYLDAKSGQEYRYLRASSSARAHSDGGIVSFARDTLVDTTRSVGLLSQGVTYCVAPVLDVDTEQPMDTLSVPSSLPQEIQFWAIGLDCCGARGYFACDDAQVVGARSAFVYHAPDDSLESSLFAPSSHYDEFLRAVEAAKAMYNLAGTREPVLVRWVLSPQQVLEDEFHASLYLWWGTTLAVAIVSMLVWIPAKNYYHMKMRDAYEAVKETKIQAAARAYMAANSRGSSTRGRSPGRPEQDPFLMGNPGSKTGQPANIGTKTSSPSSSPPAQSSSPSPGPTPSPAKSDGFSMSALFASE